MTTSTQIDNLKINKLTLEQYENITPNPTELYMIVDDAGITGEDVTDALGYTPNQTIIATNTALTATGGLVSWVITNPIGLGVQVALYEITSGEEIIPNSVDVTASNITITLLATSNVSANTYRAVIQG